MNSIEDRIQALEDRAEIAEAVSKYSLFILAGEAGRIPELFTDDGIFAIRSGNLLVEGRDALVAFFGQMQPGSAFPFVKTDTIELRGDEADHTGAMMGNPANGRIAYLGIYKDKMRKSGGRWLFAERNFTFIYGDPFAGSGN